MEIINGDTIKSEKLTSLNKREVERQLNLQKAKQNIESHSAQNEKLEVFLKIFDEKKSLISKQIEGSNDMPARALLEHFNNVSRDIHSLQKYVSNSSIFLRNYDLQKCQATIQDLQADLRQCEQYLIPKKKFSFKNSKTKLPKIINDKPDEVDSKPMRIYTETITGFSNRTNETLHMSDSDLSKKDVTLSDLKNCRIYLRGTPSTLHLSRVTGCHVFSGPVSTSIFAENCSNDILVVACQQLRLHSSYDLKIYLHVTSRAIIEDCKDVRVAPYNWTYDGLEEDFRRAGLEREINNWRSLNDFNWLHLEKHSPNWREIEEAERVSDWGVAFD